MERGWRIPASRDKYIALSAMYARDLGHARFTAALVFLIQLVEGKDKGEKNSDK